MQLRQGHISTHYMGAAGLAKLYKRTLSLHVPLAAAGSYSRFLSSFPASHLGSHAVSHGVFEQLVKMERGVGTETTSPQDQSEPQKTLKPQKQLQIRHPYSLLTPLSWKQDIRGCRLSDVFSVSSNISLFHARK